MKREAALFGGVTVFFGLAALIYGWWSAYDPAGTAALTFAAVMSALITFYLTYQYRRGGTRPEDDGEGEMADGAGAPLGFFPPSTAYPVFTAVGVAVTALGVVLGLWLFFIGVGVLIPGVCGFVFEFGDRRT
ncbi:cytochrome c oxidase subunit 4 [Streptomyces montanisoli]|uniref:Cytochrome c oxidase polypeptide 4 n=1 Tax=Streptomyces montanisoli TaxID=2798581 RepID=A0A940RWW1_9ACTN|nr:cytochrome c oxidase subunit 4 [Streptomyces montanisoli]MBP0457523.1 cytochrome c oxidase subunit 4 [Streptomyces montanisoli]